MEQLLLPTQIELIKDKDPKRATLTVAPCHPGYGTTIGNALRRVLLSSLPGAAVTAVKIEGADHEFSTLQNVQEDVVQIILNLKLLRLKVHSAEPVRLKLAVTGEREVTAADIEPNAEVEVVTPDLHIATLTSASASLNMEIMVRQGRGYVPIEEREGEEREIGVIAIDSVFTPVHSVGYRVEDMRVGQKINYDKLTLGIETDGTITPAEAVEQAVKILLDHFNLLTGLPLLKKAKVTATPAEPVETPSAENPAESAPDTTEAAPATEE